MKRDFSISKFIVKAKTPRTTGQLHQAGTKSKRSYQYLHEQAIGLRRRVLLYLGVILIVYLIIFLFYSDNYKIKNLVISGHIDMASQEIEDYIWQSIRRNSWLLFPQDNYFLFSKKRLQSDFQKQYLLDELTIEKAPPDTLFIELKERTGQFIWITGERIYLFNTSGEVFKEIQAKELVNIGLPVIYDNSASNINIGDKILSVELISHISDIYQNFDKFELPAITLDSFRVDSPKANFIRIAAKEGFEIHLSLITSLDKQFNKLKRSLEEGKIDLYKIEYINLRLDNQVIYK